MFSSIKRNFALNIINTVTGLLFPLVTFPYVSRILLVDGIGQIQFFQSIINYIILFTALGIPLYAVRAVAKVRDDIEESSRIATEILLLHSLLTLIGYAIVFIIVATVAKVQVDVPLFLLLSSSLFFSAIGAPWFYQAIEDFKYITIRSLIVRICSLIALFILVKDKSDLLYYAGITVLAEVGGNIFNFIRLRKFVKLGSVCFVKLKPWRHLKPALKIFVLNLIISIYVNLDSIMLGFMKDEIAVGFYTAATRITKSVLGIVQSIGVVLLPRLSNLAGSNQMDEFRRLADKSVSLMIGLSLPLMVGLIFMAEPLIHLFCGRGFEMSILTLKIMAPIIFFISLSGIIGMQILYSLEKENVVIVAVLSGAIVNFLLNFFLIPLYAQFGAGFSTSVAEFLVTIMMIILGWKYIPVRLFSKLNRNYLFATTLITFFLLLFREIPFSDCSYLLIGTFLSIVLYICFLYFRKDFFVLQICEMLIRKLHF